MQVFHAANRSLAFKVGAATSGSGDGQLAAPRSAAWSPGGDLIAVADTGNDRVQVFHAANRSLAFKVGAAGEPGLANGRFDGPSGVAFALPKPPPEAPPPAPQGLIAVPERGNDRVSVFHANGTFAYSFGSLGTGDGNFTNPNFAAWSPDGDRIAVADFHNHRVQVFHANGTFDFKFGTDGNGTGQFRLPQAMAYSPDGSLMVVTERNNHRAQVFHAGNGTYIDEFGSRGNGTGQFDRVSYPAWSPSGDVLYLVDTFNDRVQRFHAGNWTYIDEFGSRGNGTGQFRAPLAAAWSPNGSLLAVAERANHRVQIFDANWTYVRQFGTNGNGTGELERPRSASWSPSGGEIAVADYGNHRVQVFDAADGMFARVLGTGERGSGPGQLDLPRAAAWQPSPPPPPAPAPGGNATSPAPPPAPAPSNISRIAVSDPGNHRVQLFNATGDHVGQFGTPGSGPSQFRSPQGVTWSPDGDRIAVADHFNARVQLFNSTGGYVDEFRSPPDNRDGVSGRGNVPPPSVSYVAWSPHGDRIAASNGYQIDLFNATGGYVKSFGLVGSYEGQFLRAAGIAWSPDGDRIAVVDRGNVRVQLFNATGGYVDEFRVPPDDRDGVQGHVPPGLDGVAWSPDGDRIAVPLSSQVYLFNATGSHVGQFSVGPYNVDGGIAWSPDGDRIAVSFRHNVYLFNATGSLVDRLGSVQFGSEGIGGIAWSPFMPAP